MSIQAARPDHHDSTPHFPVAHYQVIAAGLQALELPCLLDESVVFI